MEVQSLASPLREGRCWWLERAREFSPKAFVSVPSQHWPDPPVSPPTSCQPGRPALLRGKLLTATSVFVGAGRRGFSPSDPLSLSRALHAILRFQPSTDCWSTRGSRADPAAPQCAPLFPRRRVPCAPPTPRWEAESKGSAPGCPRRAAGFGEREVTPHRALSSAPHPAQKVQVRKYSGWMAAGNPLP
ncbi:interleukin-15 isoform X1 [Oryx dammah]|uniref:interleukin-15 isoform X1 n=1 Tax=Oryx dammah TaxID=59534 RepID=UPI001A9B67D7|nr:interleukin-15 isoform X1 [Oryx dammah]